MTRRSLLLAPLAPFAAPEWVAADGSPFPFQSWRLTPDALQAIGGLPTFQDIKTVQFFTEVDFEFEFKMLAGGNSGVKYQIEKWDRWQPPGQNGFHIRARGPEFQLVDDSANADARQSPLKQCGSLYNKLAPSQPARIRIGEFNSARLRIAGGRVEHWINDDKLVDYEVPALRPSAISLQNHACDVWFRKLRFTAV